MSDRVVVITGASGGIGAATARRLGRNSDAVVLGARRATELSREADEVRALGGRAHTVVMDATRRADVERLRDEAIAEFGHVDVWINSVGRGIGRRVLELTDEDVDQMVRDNLKSALYGMQAIAPYFESRGSGHLINISSYLGRVPLASIRSVYSAMKAALNSLTANLRMDLRERAPGVHVSLVMPGLVATEFARNALGGTPGVAHNAGPGALPPIPRGMGGAKPQSAEEVADVITELIEHPRAEVYTNPALKGMAERYVADVEGFEGEIGTRRG